jgi:DNA-binding GntR family transcriptional regulator
MSHYGKSCYDLAVEIDQASLQHPYLQLATRLRERIQSGQIVAQLPSLTQLTGQTGLAVGAVRRAIDVLVREGLVQTVPGRGTFVIRVGNRGCVRCCQSPGSL